MWTLIKGSFDANSVRIHTKTVFRLFNGKVSSTVDF